MGKALILIALVLSVLVSISLQITALPASVTAAMASREIRYHHFVWHNVRNLWNSLNKTTQNQITSYGWKPPRPAKDANGNSLENNNSGEDFLYFHRKMIENVQYLMNQGGYPNISLWNVIPSKTNSTYPMAPVYTTPSSTLTTLVKYYKSDTYYNKLKALEKTLTDPKYLRSVTLGQLGSYIEFKSDVHQGMHFRFSEYNKLMRVKTSVVVPYVDPKWDVVASNWLVDVYCSQVNPWFWKMHGWIDNRINDWAKANNVTNIKWTGTWLGGSTSNLPSSNNIPKDPNDRFLAKDDMSGIDMGSGASTTNSSSADDGMGMGTMNLTSLESIAAILIGTGLSCDYFNELDSTGDHEHNFDLTDDNDKCDDNKKI